MSPVFVDTSAFLALLIANDRFHPDATAIFRDLREAETLLQTSSYVLVETYALLARRAGLEAAARFRSDFAPLLGVHWIEASLHEEAMDEWLRQPQAQLSLVDVASFIVMRRNALDTAFAFDKHFRDAGFRAL